MTRRRSKKLTAINEPATLRRDSPAALGTSKDLLILGIAGSLRHDSLNRRLLQAAGHLLSDGVLLRTWDRLKTVPPFDEDDEASPASEVEALRQAVAQADALLIATPEYNASIPGQLKNALDWASRPRGASVLEGKPVAVTGASPSPFGAVRAQDDLRKSLKTAGARVVERSVPISRAPAQFTNSGALASSELADQLSSLLNELIRAASTKAGSPGRPDAQASAA
jgi:chromate reductase